jgi:hypothetical protein
VRQEREQERQDRRTIMAREPDTRIETWDKKFNTTRVKQSLDAMRPDMLAHYAAAVAKLCEMELAVKEVLNQSGIHEHVPGSVEIRCGSRFTLDDLGLGVNS